MTKSKKLIVTGGAGFIGSHVVDYFLQNGYEVSVFDNLTTGDASNIPGVKIIKGDIRDLELLKKSFKGIDYCIHCAALISVPESIDDPQSYHDVNITGTFNVLMAAKEHSLKKVLFVSSAAVYGNASVPVKEAAAGECLSAYAVNKLIGENYSRYFHTAYDVPVVIFRYFNVFGPRQKFDSAYAAVIPAFIKRYLNSDEAVIFGDGEQTRDFVFVKDVARANYLAIEKNTAEGETFNIASGVPQSVNELVKMFPVDFKYSYGPERSGDIKHSSSDVSRSLQLLGNYVSGDFKAAFLETLEWYKNLFTLRPGSQDTRPALLSYR